MSDALEIFVAGLPKGQPRPRAFARHGMVRMYDPATAEGWKSAIAAEWKASAPSRPQISEAVALKLEFYFPRPKAHFCKSGLRLSAPRWHTQKPDADNLAKAVMDALSQIGVWRDDDQVALLQTSKRFGPFGDRASGCLIRLKVL